jgi:16S rRNA (cytosine1402-N4)-methyltransferase
MHRPVMLAETLDWLDVRPEGVYLDVTAGLGGHTRAIAGRLTAGSVVASDRDADSLALARVNAAEHSARIRFLQARFSELPARLNELGIPRVDGLLADLGVSRYQLTDSERGFSLSADGPLDARMDRSQGPTAAELVNSTPEKQLADLIYQLGEERRSRRIARAIVQARPIQTTLQLAGVVERAVPRRGRLHPATQTFMALRIAVNQEQEELDSLLAALPSLVASGGRVVFLTFMSLEDRKVKHALQALAREGRARILTRHVIRPSDEEVRDNPPSRSAKLRAVEMI